MNEKKMTIIQQVNTTPGTYTHVERRKGERDRRRWHRLVQHAPHVSDFSTEQVTGTTGHVRKHHVASAIAV